MFVIKELPNHKLKSGQYIKSTSKNVPGLLSLVIKCSFSCKDPKVKGVFLSKVNTGRSHFPGMASKQAANSRLCRACSLSFFISHFILKHLFLCFRKVF